MNNIDEDDFFNTFKVLSKNNPGACHILFQLIENIDPEQLDPFFVKILENKILGPRLWYIYKNECNSNINELLEKNVTPFDDAYFYEKFEKYI